MKQFYMIECFVPEGATIRDIYDYPEVEGVESWILGAPFSTPPRAPIELRWDPETSGSKKMYYDATIPLMDRGLIQALRACGIDNIDTYPVTILDSRTGEVDRQYSAVNVIGVVSAADLSKSKYSDPSGRGLVDMDFDSLALDPARSASFELFRLAECVTALVVGSRVKKELEAKGGFGLAFVEPSSWIG